MAAGTYTGMRALAIGPAGTLLARGLIDAEMPILLADFETTATDPDVGRIVTEALRIDLPCRRSQFRRQPGRPPQQHTVRWNALEWCADA